MVCEAAGAVTNKNLLLVVRWALLGLSFLTVLVGSFPTLAAYFRHVAGIAAYGHTAFTSCGTGLFRVELVRSTFGMCSLAAFTCNGPLLFRIHGGKATVRSLACVLLCTCVTVIHDV